MATGSPFLPTTHPPSHWFSCGHTRPVMAGSALSSRIFAAAPRKSPAQISATISCILTPTGQSPWHPGLAQARQRMASVAALSALRPWFTSSKQCARTSGSSSGMATRGIFIRSLRGSGFASGMAPFLLLAHRALRATVPFPFPLRRPRRELARILPAYAPQSASAIGTPFAIHRIALHQHLKVHQRGVELRPVHAGELALDCRAARGSRRTCPCRPP